MTQPPTRAPKAAASAAVDPVAAPPVVRQRVRPPRAQDATASARSEDHASDRERGGGLRISESCFVKAT